jgi:hypothetical protein
MSLTREELYEEVWAHPMIVVAERHQVSETETPIHGPPHVCAVRLHDDRRAQDVGGARIVRRVSPSGPLDERSGLTEFFDFCGRRARQFSERHWRPSDAFEFVIAPAGPCDAPHTAVAWAGGGRSSSTHLPCLSQSRRLRMTSGPTRSSRSFSAPIANRRWGITSAPLLWGPPRPGSGDRSTLRR